MKVLKARNVHQALPLAIQEINSYGLERGSRNGPVLVSPVPITTEYEQSRERLVFWPQRDVNTAFLVYEALWMLAGRNDLAPLLRYVSSFGRYSDDGVTLHGAYGHRWRNGWDPLDQLTAIVDQLKANPDDRRCVLQMWEAAIDLGRNTKDVPCNVMATFQINTFGALDLTVFCRSNDIIWGAYFANAFHFSVLQEYMAGRIGCHVGTYRQISVNWHAYLDTLAPLRKLPDTALARLYSVPQKIDDPYGQFVTPPLMFNGGTHIDAQIQDLLADADSGFSRGGTVEYSPWMRAAYYVLKAHHQYKTLAAPERFERALATLAEGTQTDDLIFSMEQWIRARGHAWQVRMNRAQDDGVAHEPV